MKNLPVYPSFHDSRNRLPSTPHGESPAPGPDSSRCPEIRDRQSPPDAVPHPREYMPAHSSAHHGWGSEKPPSPLDAPYPPADRQSTQLEPAAPSTQPQTRQKCTQYKPTE